MKSCNEFQKMIWLDIYGELSDEQKNKLTDHLKSCVECQLDYEESLKAYQLFDKKTQQEPNENLMKELRNELHHRLNILKKPNTKTSWPERFWHIITLDFAPVARLGTALALLIIGMAVGSRFFQSTYRTQAVISKKADVTDSWVAGMESIQYNPRTKKVEIKLNTIQDITVEGNLNKPEIQKLLAQVLIADERPNIRLRTVRALENTQYFGRDILDALVEIIEEEENPGIRLRALKVLTAVPITSEIKSLITKVLVKVLLNDSNTAMRIEAFNKLNKFDKNIIDSKLYNVVTADSSEYIRTQSSQMLERTENPKY